MADLGFEFGTNIADKALNSIVEFCKDKFGKASVNLGIDFDRYLKNAYERYNHIKTLATGTTPRNIIGEDSIYVNVGVIHSEKIDFLGEYDKKDEICTKTVEPMLRESKHILITGTGGAGKSMLMRYLFLNTRNSGTFVPVFLRLNKISEQPVDNISVFDLIYSAMDDFDVRLPKEMFEYSLRQGKYLFLLDGFDEIKESHSKKAAEAIQSFCSKYPENPCIVTSRPSSNTTPLETFTVLEMCNLDEEQAKELICKIGETDEKTEAFLKELDEKLFEEPYDSFTENPLLLSMMFLAFRRNNSIADRMADFYGKAYEALYNLHDSTDKGAFKREFKSSLDERQFKDIFAYFCFQSYMAEIYSFDKNKIVALLEKSLAKCGADKSQARNYLDDLTTAVCLLVREGTDYVFAHRSFQAYFAALYTEKMNDDTQKKLFNKLLHKESCHEKEAYYEILIQLTGDKFAENALEDSFRKLGLDKPVTEESTLRLVRAGDLSVYYNKYGIVSYFGKYGFDNYFWLFDEYKNARLYRVLIPFSNEENKKRFEELLMKADIPKDDFYDYDFYYREIVKSYKLTADEKRELLLIIIKESRFDKFLQLIHDWLCELDLKRKKRDESSDDDNWFENF